MKTKHTPTPWIRKDDGHIYKNNGVFEYPEIIAGNVSKSNAEFIVRAVNSYKELLNNLIMALPYVECALEDRGYKPNQVDRMVKSMRDAIAKTETRP